MKKFLFKLLLAMCFVFNCAAEAAGPMYPGWLTVMVPNIAQFDVPPILEVQTKEYRDIVRKSMPDYPDPAPGCVTLQRKGLLEQARQGTLEPQCVMITFAARNLGQDSGFKRGKLGMTAEDLQDFANYTRQDVMRDTNSKYFDWTPATIEKLSCGESIKLGYKRQHANAPVTQYYINYVFDGAKLYTITVAYYVGETERWCSTYGDVRKIPSTLKLVKE